MKQQINLYKSEKVKKGFSLNSRETVWIYGGFLTLLILMTVFSIYKHLAYKKELDILGKQKIEQSKKLQAISSHLPELETRNQIINEIKRLDLEQKNREEILSLLVSAQSERLSGFAGYLEALAKQTVPGLWMTRFSFKNNGITISIEGVAQAAEAVPKLIAALSKEPVLKGKTFQLFKLNLDEKTKLFNFTLESELSKQAS